MTTVKLAKFMGTAPRFASELLPETAAQTADNCKLYSGDIIPYYQPVNVAAAGRTGTIRTLFGLRDPATQELKWLTWMDEIDIATPAADILDEQRFYYTGDGVPKVSTYPLATNGALPYPVAGGFYELGLPLPTQTPTAVATSFTPTTAASFARDGGGNVTLSCQTPHNLKDGALATISGFAYRNGTYARAGTTITVTIIEHGLVTGARVYLEFTSGGATTNAYVVTVTGVNTFTCVDTVSGAIASGNVRWDIRDLNTTTEVTVINPTTLTYYSPGPQVALTNVQKAAVYSQTTTTITVTLNNHGLQNGDKVTIDFTSGTAIDGEFTVGGATTNTFTVTSTVSTTTGGNAIVTVITPGTVDLGGLVQSRSYLYTWFTPWNEESIGSEPTTPLFMKEGQLVTVSNLPTAPPAGANFIRGIRLYRTLASSATSASGADADFFRLATLWFPQQIASVSRTANRVTLTFAEQHKYLAGDRLKLAGCSVAGFDITDAEVDTVPDKYTVTYLQSATDVALTLATGTVYYDFAENPSVDAARYFGDGSYDFVDDFNYRSLTNILTSNDYDPPPANLQGMTVIQNNILAGFVGNDLYFTETNQFHAWPEKYKISLEYNIVGLVTLGGDMLVLTEAYPYVVSGTDPAVLTTTKAAVNYPCLSKRSIVQTDVGVIYASHDGLVLASFTAGVQLASQAVHSADTWRQQLDPSTIVATFYDNSYFASYTTGTFMFVRSEQMSGYFVNSPFTFTSTWYDAQGGALYYTTGTSGDIVRWDDRLQPGATYDWKSKTFVIPTPVNIGAARVVADYPAVIVDSPLWGAYDVNWEDADILWFEIEPITFRFWADKTLVMEHQLSDSLVFRLPAGYKSDTFEVGVEGSIRVRSIHLGETPSSLQRS